jgi:hypothetical protein
LRGTTHSSRPAVRSRAKPSVGTDYAKAVERVETVLLPALDEWRTGVKLSSSGVSPAVGTSPSAVPGTLDWVFAEYRADRCYTASGVDGGGGYLLKDGRRLGLAGVASERDVPMFQARRQDFMA